MENLPFFSLVFCASVDVGRFLTKTRFRPWIHQPSESFGLTLATETTFSNNFCWKTARYRLFLAVVRCCVTTTLAAETFGLLNVYLNYKFGHDLPSFYLFFNLFKKWSFWNDNLAKEARRLKSKIEFEDWCKRWRSGWISWSSTKSTDLKKI